MPGRSRAGEREREREGCRGTQARDSRLSANSRAKFMRPHDGNARSKSATRDYFSFQQRRKSLWLETARFPAPGNRGKRVFSTEFEDSVPPVGLNVLAAISRAKTFAGNNALTPPFHSKYLTFLLRRKRYLSVDEVFTESCATTEHTRV